jgi:hypothetical protein
MISPFFSYYKDNKQYKIKEISFNQFKHLNKHLLNEDLKELQIVFDDLCKVITPHLSLNCLEKFYCLMVLRTMTHGNDFSFKLDEKLVNVNLNLLLDKINFKFDNVEYSHENLKLYFNLPKQFIHSTIIDLVIDCLVAVEINGKMYDCFDLSMEEKSLTVNQLTIPIVEISKTLQDYFVEYNFVFSKDFTFSILDGSLLLLLRRLFYLDMSSLYDFEYSCIRSLSLKSQDFDNYTLPELRIFLQLLTKELKSKQPVNELNS